VIALAAPRRQDRRSRGQPGALVFWRRRDRLRQHDDDGARDFRFAAAPGGGSVSARRRQDRGAAGACRAALERRLT